MILFFESNGDHQNLHVLTRSFPTRRSSDRASAKAVAPAQAVALSTQSSLASLPPMLKASTDLGIDRSVSRVSLPVAVAIFRVTSPAMNLAVAIYVAHWLGISLAPSTIAAGADRKSGG